MTYTTRRGLARRTAALAFGTLTALAAGHSWAAGGAQGRGGACPVGTAPQLSFIQFNSPNIDPAFPRPVLTIKGKLSLPLKFKDRDDEPGCVSITTKVPPTEDASTITGCCPPMRISTERPCNSAAASMRCSVSATP